MSGSVITNFAPSAYPASRWSVPPCWVTICRAKASPNPVPSVRVGYERFENPFAISGGTPGPQSITQRESPASVRSTASVTTLPAGENAMAFSTRHIRALASVCSSAMMRSGAACSSMSKPTCQGLPPALLLHDAHYPAAAITARALVA